MARRAARWRELRLCSDKGEPGGGATSATSGKGRTSSRATAHGRKTADESHRLWFKTATWDLAPDGFMTLAAAKD